MKIKLLTAALFISALCFGAPKYNPGSFVYIDVENKADFARTDVPVVVKIDSITSKLKHYTNQRICLFINDKEINTQFDDTDGDGKKDEVAFMLNLKAGQKQRVMARIVPTSYNVKNYEQEVYSVLMHRTKNADNTETTRPDTAISSDKDDMYNKVYLHGMVFESGPVAYRVYFNNKQTIDVYGKVKSRLEIPITQWHTTNKQLSEGYGDDILLVGNSVGVGTFKGWSGSEAIHTDAFGKRTQRIVSKGHLRNIMELELNDWEYQGQKINAKIRYTQYARHRDVQVDVFLSDNAKGMSFCSGVQKFPEDMRFSSDENNLVAMWGKGFAQKDTVKHPNKETVGMAVAIAPEYSDGIKEDPLNQLIIMKPGENNSIRYFFQAFWLKEQNGFKTPDEYFNYTKQWKKNVLAPVSVTFSTK